MAANRQTDRQTDRHTHVRNAVTLMWGSLKLAPIKFSNLCSHFNVCHKFFPHSLHHTLAVP